jgi:RimJ/RimL family protein N-acetyltransferase
MPLDSNTDMVNFAQVTLRTPRLLMRPFRESDASDLFAVFSDARVARYLSKPAWLTIDKAHERIARDLKALPEREYLCLALERVDDGKLIGECSLFKFFEQCRRAEVGYALAYEAWGSGFMKEALEALLEFGFAKLALNRVEADIDPRNVASAKSLERLGFMKEGHLRQRWIVEGEVSDSGLYGLLLEDWKERARYSRGP